SAPAAWGAPRSTATMARGPVVVIRRVGIRDVDTTGPGAWNEVVEVGTGFRGGGSALVNGGAGGVGHHAVQIARATATCGRANVAFVQSLGVDAVIDYNREAFRRRVERFDELFDAAARTLFG